MSDTFLRLLLLESMIFIGGTIVALTFLAVYLWFWSDRYNK